MKIGLTGSIACGKSTVSAYLKSRGAHIIDADAISHALTAPGGTALPAIRQTFGSGIFDGDVLNRRALSEIVFADKVKRQRLNDLLHPMILQEIDRRLNASDAPNALLVGDIPLLFECAMGAWFDCIWVVSAPREVQIKRMQTRDGLTRQEAEHRIDAQMTLEEKCRLADAVIDTGISLASTYAQVDALLAKLPFPVLS